MCDVFAFFYIILYFLSRYLSVDFYCYYFEVYNYAVIRLLCFIGIIYIIATQQSYDSIIIYIYMYILQARSLRLC